jgi:hypothetical protein
MSERDQAGHGIEVDPECIEKHRSSASDLDDLLCCCDDCNDGDGWCVFPYTGLAPHQHKVDSMIGSTEIAPESEWPENFCEDSDPDWSGTGTYTHCLSCGRPGNERLHYQDIETRKKREAMAT